MERRGKREGEARQYINEEFVFESPTPYLRHPGFALLWSTMTHSSGGKLHVQRIHIVVLEWMLGSRRLGLLFGDGEHST